LDDLSQKASIAGGGYELGKSSAISATAWDAHTPCFGCRFRHLGNVQFAGAVRARVVEKREWQEQRDWLAQRHSH
jgi:hypothetical protein